MTNLMLSLSTTGLGHFQYSSKRWNLAKTFQHAVAKVKSLIQVAKEKYEQKLLPENCNLLVNVELASDTSFAVLCLY
jgi:hypothetical protein